MSFLDRVRACQVFRRADYLPFVADGERIGFVRPALAEALKRHPGVFAVSSGRVELAPDLVGFEARSRAVDTAVRALIEDGVLGDWRDEPYVVGPASGRPLFTMDRGAVPPFGVRGYGVHLNGYVRADADLRMWVGRRSPTKRTAPDKLDQLVAGGQPAGLAVAENLAKEAAEEAAIPESLIRRARPVGAIAYCTERDDGLRNDLLFVYDLELPADFVPRNTDGELVGFELLPIDQVAAIVRDSDEFKFNCALVVIDFLIRHGRLGPEHPDYVELVCGLRWAPV